MESKLKGIRFSVFILNNNDFIMFFNLVFIVDMAYIISEAITGYQDFLRSLFH